MRIGKLAASRKLILMLFLCLAAAAVPTTLLLDELTAQADRAVQAAAGAKSVKAVLECIALVQRHRALSNEVLSSNAALTGQRSAVKAKTIAALALLIGAGGLAYLLARAISLPGPRSFKVDDAVAAAERARQPAGSTARRSAAPSRRAQLEWFDATGLGGANSLPN